MCAIAALISIANVNIAQQAPNTNPTLKIGDPAPPVKVMKWAKTKGAEVSRFTPGEAVKFEREKVYALEFWATWCGPCKVGMPHLSELARHYAGRVTVIGISIRENIQGKNPDYAPKVQAFVDQKGAGMDYNVAIDGADDAMDIMWMRASGLLGVPNALVVTQDGKIGWMGHPLNGMREALDLALAGKLDEKTAKALMNANAANDKKWRELLPRVNKALNVKDYGAAKNALDEMDHAVPGYMPWTVTNRYQLLAQTDPAAAHDLAEKHYKINYNSEEALPQIAAEILNSKNIKEPDYPMALKVFLRLKELQATPNPRIAEMLAKTYAMTGDFAAAAKSQEEYIMLIKAAGRGVEEAQKQLEEYKAKI